MAGKAINARNSHELKLHEATSRGLCQLTFLLLGALPVLLCVAWVAIDAWPGYRVRQVADCEQWLSSRVGLTVQIEQIDWKTPQRYVLSEVRLQHPETRQTIASIKRATVEQIRGQTIVQLEQPRLDAAHMLSGWRALHDWLLCRPELISQIAVIQANTLLIDGLEAEPIDVSDIVLQFFPKEHKRLLSIDFGLPNNGRCIADSPADGPVGSILGTTNGQPSDSLAQTNAAQSTSSLKLIVNRHTGPDGLQTDIQLRTGATALPCSFFQTFAPQLSSLGANAKFAGVLNIHLRDDSWALRIGPPQGTESVEAQDAIANAAPVQDGRLLNVDFEQLTADTTAALRGEGEILLRQMEVTDAGLTLAYGNVEILQRGTVSCRFLDSVANRLGLQFAGAQPQVGFADLYDFDAVKFEFYIGDNRFHWFGRGPRGAILTSRGLPLAVRAVDYWNEPLPLSNLVRVLDEATRPAVVMASARGGDVADALPNSWLSRAALSWLPIGTPQAVAEPIDDGKSQLRQAGDGGSDDSSATRR